MSLAVAACTPSVPALTSPGGDDEPRGDGSAADGRSPAFLDAGTDSARDGRLWSLDAERDGGTSAAGSAAPRGGAGGLSAAPDGNGGQGGSRSSGGGTVAQGGLGLVASGGQGRHEADGGVAGGWGHGASGDAGGGDGGHARGDGGGNARGGTDGTGIARGGANGAGNVGRGGTDGAGIARAPKPGDLLIDEIMIDPAGADLGKEWVEVHNGTADPLDLSQLVLADDVSSHSLAPLPGLAPRPLAAGGWAVLGQSGDVTKNGGVSVDWVYGTQLGLNNGGDRVALCWIRCDGGLLAELRWTSQDPGLVGRALVIEPEGRRCPASSPYGPAGEEDEAGTPGTRNDPCP